MITKAGWGGIFNIRAHRGQAVISMLDQKADAGQNRIRALRPGYDHILVVVLTNLNAAFGLRIDMQPVCGAVHRSVP